MHPLQVPLLADENVAPEVVHGLRADGLDVVTVLERGLGGRSGVDVLAVAHAEGRAVLTHDSDFGTLAFRERRVFTGVVFVRPGHVDARTVLAQIRAIQSLAIQVEPPFIVVAERRGEDVRVRVRRIHPA